MVPSTPRQRRQRRPRRALAVALAVALALLALAAPARAQLGALVSGAKAGLLESQARDLFRTAKKEGEFLRAAREYGRIAASWEKAGNRGGQASAQYFVGRSYFLAGRPDSALAAYELGLRALRTPWRESKSSRLGWFLERQEQQKSPEPAGPSDSLIARSLRREIGAVYLSLGRPDSALAQFLGAQDGCLDKQHLDPRVLYDYAVDSARQNAKKGDEIPDYPSFYCLTTHAYIWPAIGAAFLDVEQPDSALEYFRRAAAEAHGDGRGGALGAAGRRMTDAFSDLFFTSPRFANESRVRSGMAEAFVRLGQPDSAMRQFRRVLAIDKPGARLLQTSDWRGLTRSLVGIGDIMLARGQRDSAGAYFAKALDLTRNTGDLAMEALSLHRLARYHEGAPDAAQRARALAYFDSASAANARSRTRAPGDENRLALAERNLGIEGEWALAFLRGDAGPPDDAAARTRALSALAAVERGRARALLEFLQDSAAERAAGAGADLAAAGDSLARAAVRGGRVVLTFAHARDTLLTWLVAPDGRVAVTRRPIAADSLWGLVEELRAALGVADAPARGLLPRDEPPGTRGALAGRSRRPDPAAAGRALSAAILPPELAPLLQQPGTELLVVPSGVLHVVPFAALPVAGADELLGAIVPLRVAPSLAVAAQLSAASAGASAKRAAARPLLVGNPQMPLVRPPDGRAPQPLPPLPGAESEVRWLAQRLGARALTGKDATRSAVLAQLRTSSLVHFATHGFAYASNELARSSFLAVAPEGMHSGMLTAGELLDSDVSMSAELVVLSACQTALGGIRASEGVVGLQRAFLAKGARGVLASLWSVSDEATRLLMERFYIHWLDDADAPTTAEALRRAARDVRTTPGFDHPRFWAAFQLVGGA